MATIAPIPTAQSHRFRPIDRSARLDQISDIRAQRALPRRVPNFEPPRGLERTSMRMPRAFPVLLVTSLVSACAGTTDAPAREFVTVTLNPAPRVAGEIGRAFLMPQDEGTRVLIEVSGVPPLVSTRPVRLYTFVYPGACGKLADKPAYALLDRVIAQSPSSAGMVPLSGPFTVSNTAPLPMEKLREGNYAIVVKTSPADGNLEIFCGDVR